MFENVDEFLLCRPYVKIWALVIGRITKKSGSAGPILAKNGAEQWFFIILYLTDKKIYH